ncbi:hypothetical protein Tco_1005838 [Tanacetum coccineum]|uniref:Uncharacterized protein n=1 Tax=Tanacetum coccineum TaxID=301880 RepID=A0ABQ5FG27_9ASTR
MCRFSSTNLVLVLNTLNALLLIEYPTKNPSSDFPSNLPSSIVTSDCFNLMVCLVFYTSYEVLKDLRSLILSGQKENLTESTKVISDN